MFILFIWWVSGLRLLVTGITGLLGAELYHGFRTRHTVLGVSRRAGAGDLPCAVADLTDLPSVTAVFKDFRPDVCIHCAGMSDPDACEADPDTAFRVNVHGTAVMAHAAATSGARLIFCSTDYVFDGAEPSYTETATPKPLQIYGWTKRHAEALVRDLPGSVILRLGLLYGSGEGRGRACFVRETARRLEAGEPIRACDQQVRYPTICKDVAAIIHGVIEGGHIGVFHVAGPESVTKFAWARRIAQLTGFRPEAVERAPPSERPARRPSRVHLDTRNVQRALDFRFTSVDDGILSTLPLHGVSI